MMCARGDTVCGGSSSSNSVGIDELGGRKASGVPSLCVVILIYIADRVYMTMTLTVSSFPSSS